MAVLGIELGSTRIKGVLIDQYGEVLATGAYAWENRLENGFFTYPLEEVWTALADVIAQIRKAAPAGVSVECLGFSAMMHGYLAFGRDGELLTPFRTWRNTTTGTAAAALSKALSFNIPQRWSAAHLYQAILDGEEHVHEIACLTTLAGYVHWTLTGDNCLGVGDASGMFPMRGEGYDDAMLQTFERLAAEKGYVLHLSEILPRVCGAGDYAGQLTEEGASRLDPTGWLQAGTPLCPPEGDAGTGMVATNSIAPRTGNVSAGTSIFAMIVLEKPLTRVYPEIDIVMTPTGNPVAMVHCNNCSSDIDAWGRLFGEVIRRAGAAIDANALYDLLYGAAIEAGVEPDAGGLLSYNYYSGEPITETSSGVPLLLRRPDSVLNLANLSRSLLFSSVATLKMGMDILTERERVTISHLNGHGGLFKSTRAGQRILSSSLGVPVRVSETAGEGGAWGIAVLAGYRVWRSGDESLHEYLQNRLFTGVESCCEMPDASDAAGFARYMEKFAAGLRVEREAAALLDTL